MRVDSGSAYDKKEDEKRKWDFRYTMGIIICVLVIAVGVAAIFGDGILWNNNKSALERDRVQGNVPPQDDGAAVAKPVPTVDSKDSPKPEANPGPGGNTGAIYIEPVEGGSLVREFSGDGLVYSKTLDQYAIHQGVDFEAPADTAVRAISGGIVTSVTDDPQMGITIEVTQDDGAIVRYSNLSTKEMVEEGDAIQAGAVISGVGSTALFESLDPPHLHLEVWKNGVAVDPMQFF